MNPARRPRPLTGRTRVLPRSATAGLAASFVVLSSVVGAPPAQAATVDVSTLAGITTAWANGDTARLTGDITVDPGQLDATGAGASPSVLDLAGHDLTITGPLYGPAVRIRPGRSLTVGDSSGGGVLTATGGAWGAGIGGGISEGCGSLQIDGAHVVGIAVIGVVTNYSGAGIGGGGGDGLGVPPGAGCTVSMTRGHLEASAAQASGASSAAAVGAGSDQTFPAGAGGSVSVAGAPSTAVGALGNGYGAHGGAAQVPASSGAAPGLTWSMTATDATATAGATATLRSAYAVTFDAAGGSAVSTQLVPHGDPAAVPAVPSRAGYVLAGWHTGSASGPTWDPATPVFGPTTVVAAWTAAPVGSPPVGSPPVAGAPGAGSVTLGATTGERAAGSAATVTTSGLRPGSAWALTLHSTPVTLATGTVPADGAVATTATLPAHVPAGDHRVEFTATGADGTAFTTAVWFRVDGAGTVTAVSATGPVGPTLANTGVDDAVPLTVLGGLLVLAGAGAMVGTRRRS